MERCWNWQTEFAGNELGFNAHARSERVLSANFDGVISVAVTRKIVTLQFWVQPPGNAPTFPRPIWLGQLLHMEMVQSSSLWGTTV